MHHRVRVHLLPSLFEPEELTGGTAVVIDVLRASTTMIQALSAGARAVLPCAAVEDAVTASHRFSPSQRLLGGERHGVLIEGFDLGNSPHDYLPTRVAGRTLLFTTTNGTAALRRACQAAEACVGAMVNLSAVVAQVCRSSRPIHLLCAGTDGRISTEDILCAGLLAERLLATDDDADDSTQLAVALARQHGGTPDAILKALRNSRGGRNLIDLGFHADIEFAARCDAIPIVPVWNGDTGELRTALRS